MPHANKRYEQLCLLSPMEKTEVERERPHSLSCTSEAESVPRARKVCKPPLSEAGMIQEKLPGITWPELAASRRQRRRQTGVGHNAIRKGLYLE
jgi:hypothetical protein